MNKNPLKLALLFVVVIFIQFTRSSGGSAFTRSSGKSVLILDCLQSAFSLKIRLVLISASAIANHDVTIRDWDETRKEGFFFLLRLTPSFIAARAFTARVLVSVTWQRKIRDCIFLYSIEHISHNFGQTFQMTTTKCRARFRDLHSLFPINFRVGTLPHANTVNLPYRGIDVVTWSLGYITCVLNIDLRSRERLIADSKSYRRSLN